MKVSKRAKQDFAIWEQIVNPNVKVVKTPNLNSDQIFFWKELMRLYEREKPIETNPKVKLHRYEFRMDVPLIFYSGGLESSVIKAMFPMLPTFEYLKENIFPWTNPIEPALMIVGAGLGYGTSFLGSELLEGCDMKVRTIEDFCIYRSYLWWKYSGAVCSSPVQQLTKHDLFKIAVRDEIPFYSCFSNNPEKVWCGKCYKCLLIDMLYKLEGLESPITMQVSEEDILTGKVGRINEHEIMVYKRLKEKWLAKKSQL